MSNKQNGPTEIECGSSLAEDAWKFSLPSTADALSQKQARINTTSHDEAAIQLRQLRSQIASDIIIDSVNTNNESSPYPTFLSPLQLPSMAPHTGTPVPLIYCDHTASHRPSASIENFLRSRSYPCHANTHTNITYTGSQSTAFVAEARQIVAESTGARVTGKASVDCVIFTGNGVTGAVATLIDALNLRAAIKDDNRPIVFVGPHEHHSNLLPWREAGCEVVTVPADKGMVDLVALECMLSSKKFGNNSTRLRIGTFSAVSNVTGLIADVDRIAILLHRYHCLAFFDYASGAPYLKMNMNPLQSEAYKDGIYFSPHKCYGGTSTPGVLVVKKRLVSQTNPPRVCGGGTVFYVTEDSHRFLSNRIERYEGGTPDGIGIQRVGLTMLASRRVTNEYERIVQSVESHDSDVITKLPNTLLEYECSTYEKVVAELKKHAPNLIMLGCNDTSETQDRNNPSCIGRHLPVFSFLIRCGKRFLHYNYVCAILNDVFGVQSRGGCQCAGPYSQYLLGLTKVSTEKVEGWEYLKEVPNRANREIERALLRSDRPCELLRPGYTRLSLPFKGLREEEVDYVVRALIWVAKHAWVLLPQYTCDHRTGEWRHWSRRGKPLGKERRWLSHFDILSPKSDIADDFVIEDASTNQGRLDLALNHADAILVAAKGNTRFLSEVEKMSLVDGMRGSGNAFGKMDDKLEELRWYVYQQECVDALRDGLDEVPFTMDQNELLGGVLRNNLKDDGHVHDMDLENEKPSGKQISNVPIPNLLSFQEGNHSGEASFEEIKAGYEDGELSEECVIFYHESDEWIPIETFLQKYEDDSSERSNISKKRDLSAMAEINKIESFEKDKSELTESMNKELVAPMCSVLNAAASKREKKKPSRATLQWGSCSAPHITSSTEMIQGSSILEEKKIDCPDSKVTDCSSKPNRAKTSKKNKQTKPTPKMMRFITQAMIQWDMIQEGDRLLLGLSGGKDSLSLLHCLLEFQRKLPIKFDIEVCTIDPMTPSFDPSPLIPYVEGLGLKYHYIRDDIVQRASSSGKDGKTVSSLCAFCARMKRGNLYTCARKNNCNKLVLAQHLDDCAESFLMSIMHNGFIRTMKANYKINAGDISVIRPLVYCRESLMTEFAKSANLPIINENCPACFEEPKERARIKKLLSREETLYPNLYDHIRRALIPVMHDDSTAIMRSYLEETIAKSVKVSNRDKKKGSQLCSASKFALRKNEHALQTEFPPDPSQDIRTNLASATEEQLTVELARRRAAKFHLSGAMKCLTSGDDDDPTGQVCTLNGGNGSIPCRELME